MPKRIDVGDLYRITTQPRPHLWLVEAIEGKNAVVRCVQSDGRTSSWKPGMTAELNMINQPDVVASGITDFDQAVAVAALMGFDQ